MISVETHVGRLVEIRQTGSISLGELQASGATFGAVLSQLKGKKIVMCTDWRGMRVLSPEVAEALHGIIKNDHPFVERQGVLLDRNAVLGLQLDRLLTAGGTMARRGFHDSGAMQEWLAEVLTLQERNRVKAFLK